MLFKSFINRLKEVQTILFQVLLKLDSTLKQFGNLINSENLQGHINSSCYESTYYEESTSQKESSNNDLNDENFDNLQKKLNDLKNNIMEIKNDVKIIYNDNESIIKDGEKAIKFTKFSNHQKIVQSISIYF